MQLKCDFSGPHLDIKIHSIKYDLDALIALFLEVVFLRNSIKLTEYFIIHPHCSKWRQHNTNFDNLKKNVISRFSANPPPSITWITPKREVFHWNPDTGIPDVFKKHPHAHDSFMTPLRVIPPRIQVRWPRFLCRGYFFTSI